jgi:hypothetical protein
MKTFTKTLLAACTMALASSVMAAETGTGDRGANNQVGPQSPSDVQLSPEQYKAANKAAKDNYNTAIRNCSSMTGKELSMCRADAKTARKQAIKDAREANRSMSSNDTTPTAMAAPGTTPADRGERAVRRQSQAEGPKP